MASTGFGEHLRREREMRGVSLQEIAGATRISTRYLDALEKEAWDRLPGGVFNRGFVRTVARFLGLEEENLLAEYALAKGERDVPPAPSHQSVQLSSTKQKFSRLALAVIPMVLALAAGGWWGWQWIAERQAELNAVAASPPATPATPSAPSNLWATEDAWGPAPVKTEDPRGLVSPWASTPRNLELRIDATRDTAVTITSDGLPAFSGRLSAGESRTVDATSALTVEAHDSGAIRMELNGQELAPLGPSGQPGRITLRHTSTPAP